MARCAFHGMRAPTSIGPWRTCGATRANVPLSIGSKARARGRSRCARSTTETIVTTPTRTSSIGIRTARYAWSTIAVIQPVVANRRHSDSDTNSITRASRRVRPKLHERRRAARHSRHRTARGADVARESAPQSRRPPLPRRHPNVALEFATPDHPYEAAGRIWLLRSRGSA